jgi:hypothetical protein
MLSTTISSKDLQVTFISGGHVLHPQPEDASLHGDRICISEQQNIIKQL